MEHSAWQLEGHVARLHHGDLSASVDLQRPAEGLFDVRMAGKAMQDVHVLKISAIGDDRRNQLAPCTECYVRGTDLVANYEQSTEAPVRVQIYWRAISPGGEGAALECIVSIQTDQMGIAHEVRLESQLPRGEIWQLTDADPPQYQRLTLSPAQQPAAIWPDGGDGVFLFRRPDKGPSFAQTINPSDWQTASIIIADKASGPVTLQVTSRQQQMEKGVIRKLRTRGMFLPRERDQQLATECYAQFITAALPLTT